MLCTAMIIFHRHMNLPPLPCGLQIMADQGFQNQSPLLVPIGNNGNLLRGIIGNLLRGIIKE